MEYRIQFSKDFEVRRIQKTLDKLSWYLEQGYDPTLPQGVAEYNSRDEIKFVVDEEYREQRYQEAADNLNSDFEQNMSQIKSAFQALKLTLPRKIEINLTRYGVGGSYEPPSTIILSLRIRDPFKTLIHELVHLAIQEKIDEYDIQHWDKERIVDLITHEPEFAFSGIEKWQKAANPKIDSNFRTRFTTDRDRFYQEINKA